MEMLSALLALCEYGDHLQMVINWELLCFLCYSEQDFEQTIAWPVILDALTLAWPTVLDDVTINPLWYSDAIWRHKSGSTLAREMG